MTDTLIERLRECDRNSVQRTLGSDIFGKAADRLEAMEAELTEQERRIVEWLRGESSNWSAMKEGLVAAAMSGAANTIERGEHRK